jgi:hypothetical protein
MGSAIRFLAVAISVVVALGFVLFAVDELSKGSEAQQRAVTGDQAEGAPATGAVSPSPAQEHRREKAHGAPREAIDDANDLLLSPFSGVVESDDRWVARGVPALLALLVFGLGLGLLANALPKARHGERDWRAA